MDKTQVHELLYQSYETELGGVEVYKKALECAVNEDLKEEWEKYLEETERHVEIMLNLLNELKLDPEQETPGRKVVRHIGNSLVMAMNMAQEEGDAAAAELVAAECVVHAETKDHLNWELIGETGQEAEGKYKDALLEAFNEVEEEEVEHLYHTKGWCRELWIKSLGMPAVLPPPEEEKNTTTPIGAERAKQARADFID